VRSKNVRQEDIESSERRKGGQKGGDVVESHVDGGQAGEGGCDGSGEDGNGKD